MPSPFSAPTLPFLERLLDGEKVEWKTLGEVFHTRNGYTPSKANEEFWTDGTIPWFRMEDIRANGRILYDSALHITPQAVKRNGLFKANSIILATSATIGEHALLLQDALTNQRFTNFEIKEELKNILLPKFAFYYFFIIDEWCKKHTIIGNFPSVDTQQLMELHFPIPPLRVQARIVEILDKFTQLEAELEARNKQYDFYRNRLLDFSLRDDLKGQVEWKTLGEVCNVVGRIGFRGYTRNDLVERGEGAISISPTNIVNQNLNLSAEKNTYISWEKYNESPEIMIRVGDIVLVKTGSTIGKVAIIRELKERATINPQMVVLKGISCLPAYLTYYICTPNFQLQLKSLSGQGSVPNISQARLKTIPIPLPPLSEQRRIVDILDRFDTLTNSISEGLPREIALRRKQYEYYRDALLRFPQPAPTV